MGQQTSIFQSDFQSINNDILQQSKSTCVNVCLNDFTTNKISISNSDVSGTVEIKNGCVITGASCILKSTLDNSIINDQKNQMSANITQVAGLFTILNNLATIGSKDEINQNNYQEITNETTQSLNSVCNFRNEENSNINVIDVDNDNISGNIIIDGQQIISNSQCTQTNGIKNYIQNKQSNSMTAKIEKTGCCAGIIGTVVIVIIIILGGGMILHMGKKKGDKPKTSQKPSSQGDGDDGSSNIAVTSV